VSYRSADDFPQSLLEHCMHQLVRLSHRETDSPGGDMTDQTGSQRTRPSLFGRHLAPAGRLGRAHGGQPQPPTLNGAETRAGMTRL